MAEFEAVEYVTGGAAAVLAQLVFALLFQTADAPQVRMDISDEATKPIAVSITPLPLLKLGGGKVGVGPLPKSWQRAATPKAESPLPSPQAAQTPDAIPKQAVVDGGKPNVSEDASASAPTSQAASDAGREGLPPGPGSPEGSDAGTEVDPLKARIVSRYRQELAAWFLSRFNIRGKVPFDRLKGLRAVAVVRISGDRRVFGFSVTPSGDATFDQEVTRTLEQIRSSGAQLKPPPPEYPDILGESLSVSFQCTVRAQCEEPQQ